MDLCGGPIFFLLSLIILPLASFISLFLYIQLIIFNAGELSDKLILVSYRERTFLSYYPYLWIIVFHSSVRNVLF